MESLRCLFIVQGEGRGHLTQALSLRAFLHRAGHHVCSSVVSRGGDGAAPSYFEREIGAPVRYIDSVRFVVNGSRRSINWLQTLVGNRDRLGRFREGFAVLDQEIRLHRPDVIVNFYEPLGGLYAARYQPRIPVVAVAHQFMFLHPQYVFPHGYPIQRRAATLFTKLTGARAARRLALSLYDAPAIPGEGLHVMPPLLRDGLIAQPLDVLRAFFLIYLYHHSGSEAVLRWHDRNPDVRLHCFRHDSKADKTVEFDDTLTFHQLHGQRFLDMMARCSGVVTNSGFESMAEAMYLCKPLLLVPMRRHFEQLCNGIDGQRVGAAVCADTFNLDLLIRFLPKCRYDPTTIRSWIATAERRFVAEIECAVATNRRIVVTRAIAVSDLQPAGGGASSSRVQ